MRWDTSVFDPEKYVDTEQIYRLKREVLRLRRAVTPLTGPPTTIAGIYGMNFDHMPELHWRFGYLLDAVFVPAA